MNTSMRRRASPRRWLGLTRGILEPDARLPWLLDTFRCRRNGVSPARLLLRDLRPLAADGCRESWWVSSCAAVEILCRDANVLDLEIAGTGDPGNRASQPLRSLQQLRWDRPTVKVCGWPPGIFARVSNCVRNTPLVMHSLALHVPQLLPSRCGTGGCPGKAAIIRTSTVCAPSLSSAFSSIISAARASLEVTSVSMCFSSSVGS